MYGMGPSEQEDFFETDEGPEAVAGAFERGVKGVTARASLQSGAVIRTQFGIMRVTYGAGTASIQRRGPGARIDSSANVRESLPSQ